MYADASFAGDVVDSKSTTGGYLFLIGPNTCGPLGHMVKKQGAVSHSSTETEVIALDACLRVDGIPALMFWEQALEVLCDKKTLASMTCDERFSASAKYSAPSNTSEPIVDSAIEKILTKFIILPQISRGTAVPQKDVFLKILNPRSKCVSNSVGLRYVTSRAPTELIWISSLSV